jgi:hypothetical protein
VAEQSNPRHCEGLTEDRVYAIAAESSTSVGRPVSSAARIAGPISWIEVTHVPWHPRPSAIFT